MGVWKRRSGIMVVNPATSNGGEVVHKQNEKN